MKTFVDACQTPIRLLRARRSLQRFVSGRAVVTLLALFCAAAWAPEAAAHVTLRTPTGGESFTAGRQVLVLWTLDVAHDQKDWDLYFSPDGGNSWEAIELDISLTARSFRWTIPNIGTTQGRVRIVQDNDLEMDYESTSGDFGINAVATATERPDTLPETATLLTSYPNPFTASTAVEFLLGTPEHVTLEVFDLRGQKVAVLADRKLAAGRHQFDWDAAHRAAGLYFLQFRAGAHVVYRSLVRVP